MCHLVYYLNHFPMGSGAARMNSSIQENNDLVEPVLEELTPEIFKAPNVQVRSPSDR